MQYINQGALATLASLLFNTLGYVSISGPFVQFKFSLPLDIRMAAPSPLSSVYSRSHSQRGFPDHPI